MPNELAAAPGAAFFDALVDRAWPALDVEVRDGWRLRYASGVTKRANSVLPAAEPPELNAAIDAAERFYTAREAPTVFWLSPAAQPAHLDEELARRGYRLTDPSLVLTAPVGDLLADAPVVPPPRIDEEPTREWLDLWSTVDGRHDEPALTAAAQIMTGVPAAYAAYGDGVLDAVGRAVVHDDWVGIFCMAVAPARRRRGLGRAVLTGLLAWGRDHGARRAYLLVVERNLPARALYEGMGFRTALRYHYRVRDAAAAG